MATIKACRLCRGPELRPILSLGDTPLANGLLTEEQLVVPEPRYPLELVMCADCSLVQITETIDSSVLFREYPYFSSFSDTMVRHAQALAERLAAEAGLGRESLVLEVGSNDGYLLRHYRDRGIPVLGIEPAANVASVANGRGIPTRCVFFGEDLARKLVAEGMRARIVHAHNVLAHADDLDDFTAGIGVVLEPDGLAVVEVPYVRDLVDGCEFDTIYHEHRCYFSLTTLMRLFERHGLDIVDVERLEIHGGSLRIAARPGGRAARSARVGGLLDEETAHGLNGFEYYRDFGRRVERLRERLRRLLSDLKGAGGTIAVYGASAKGSTLLNYVGLGAETLDFAADRSPAKQGRFLPGTHLPIVDTTALVERMPDHCLLLAWNLRNEILEQQADYRRRGGKFIIPVPEPQIV